MWEPGSDIANAADGADLHTEAQRLSATHPEVEAFAAAAMAEIERLAKQLAFAEHVNARLETSSAVTHSASQAELLIEFSEHLSSAQQQLREVLALCDLAEWSTRTAGMGERPSVLVDDLRRLLG
jgi:hypothetical protein